MPASALRLPFRIGRPMPTVTYARTARTPASLCCAPIKPTMISEVRTAIAIGDMVWAKNTSSSSISLVMTAIRLPLSLPSSFAGQSFLRTAKTLWRMMARMRKAM